MTMHRKDELGRDATGRYRRYIGWKEGNGRLVQHMFRFGRNESEARRANARLEQLWDAVVGRWKRLKARGISTDACPMWDDVTLQIGRSIAKGDPVCVLTPPAGMEAVADASLLVWLDRLQRDFPFVPLQLPDGQRAEAALQEARQSRVEDISDMGERHSSDRRKSHNTTTTMTVVRALRGYRRHVHRKYGRSGYGKSYGNQIAFLIEHTVDMPLPALTGDKLAEWIDHFRRRPAGKRGTLSHRYCVNLIKAIREFVRWLHASDEYAWELPRKFRFGKIEVDHTPEELAARVRADTVKRFTVEELATLWEYALPVERVLILLGLNCGFGKAEMATLMLDEIFEDHTHPKYRVTANFIRRLRRKTRVYGEWLLWPETVQAIAWVKANRPRTTAGNLLLNKAGKPLTKTTAGGNANQQTAAMWNRLLSRIRKDQPAFKGLGLKYLRKTGANLIRSVAGGEAASLYLSHGPTADTEDKLLAVYANRPFGKLHKALRKLGRKLQRAVFAKVAEPFPADTTERQPEISLGQIKKIKELRAQGYKVSKIAELTETSPTTVRRYTTAGK